MSSIAEVRFLDEIIEALNSIEFSETCPNTTPVKQTDHVLGVIPSSLRSLYMLLIETDRTYRFAVSKISGSPLAQTSTGESCFLIMKRERAKVDALTIIFQQSMHQVLPEIENVGWAIREEWQIVRVGPGEYRRSYV